MACSFWLPKDKLRSSGFTIDESQLILVGFRLAVWVVGFFNMDLVKCVFYQLQHRK
jgi:hypothetical protein